MATIIGDDDTILNIERVIAMTTTDGEKKQLNIQNRIRLAVCSELRRKILGTLRDDKKALRELRKTVDVSSTTAIHALRDLEKANLIYQDEARKYALTTIGEIVTLKMVDFVDAVDVLQKHEEFWLDHDLRGIPPHMMEKIGWLKDSTVVADQPTDIFKAHETFMQVLEAANEMKGVSPIFHPEYPEIIKELVEKKAIVVELIVTEQVLSKMLNVSEEILKQLLREQNFTLFVISQDVKIAFTVTDSVFHLGLFDKKGIYDYNRDLIGEDENAISWGESMYNYYRKRSRKANLYLE